MTLQVLGYYGGAVCPVNRCQFEVVENILIAKSWYKFISKFTDAD